MSRARLAALPLALLALSAAPGTGEVRALDRVAVVGASLSAGFLVPIDLGDVLDELVVSPHEPPARLFDVTFFLSPAEALERELAAAEEARATLLLGVDLPFWFAYGDQGFEGRPMVTDEDRVASLRAFLARLDRVEARIVLGDLPDMSDAVGRMLRVDQVPSPEALEELNRVLLAWAGARARVCVLPLTEIHRASRAGEAVSLGDETWPAEQAEELLQPDRLHPTLEGLAVIARRLALELVERGWAEEADFVGEVDELVAALHRRVELPGTGAPAEDAASGH